WAVSRSRGTPDRRRLTHHAPRTTHDAPRRRAPTATERQARAAVAPGRRGAWCVVR
ncbi:MAG: hypothetical protein AVDCRST_MAG11-805, partial [uncultured Gemmatimonadaceae bacterium]